MKKYYETPFITRLGYWFFITLAISIGIFNLTGCDNSNSYDAKLEEARIFLDEGAYANAKSILQTLPRTQEVLQYMSNSIAGNDLNLDTLHIISTISDLNESGNSGSIDMVGNIIGGESNTLTSGQITDKLASATEAIGLLKEIGTQNGTGVEGLTDDQKMQLGLLSITRCVLSVAKLISTEISDQSIEISESWINAQKSRFTTVHPTTSDLFLISEDIVNTGYAIQALTNNNIIKTYFQAFINKIDSNNDNQVTSNEINAYISRM